jgi:hypothetical protein
MICEDCMHSKSVVNKFWSIEKSTINYINNKNYNSFSPNSNEIIAILIISLKKVFNNNWFFNSINITLSCDLPEKIINICYHLRILFIEIETISHNNKF